MLDPNHQPPHSGDPKLNRAALAVYSDPEGAGAEESLSTPSLSSLLTAARRRWLLAGSSALLGLFSAVLVILHFLPAPYTAYTRLMLAVRNPSLMNPGLNSGEDNDFPIHKASMASWIKSPRVISAALGQIKDLNMIRRQPMPVAWLEKQLKTDFLISPDTLRLSLSGDRPDEVAKIVNAVSEAFIKELQHQETANLQAKIKAFENNLRNVQTELEHKREALAKRIERDKLKDPDVLKADYAAALVDLSAAKKAASDKHHELIDAQQKFQEKKNSLNDLDKLPISDSQVQQALQLHPIGMELNKQIAETTKTIQEIASRAAEGRRTALLAPHYRKLEEQQKQVAELCERLRPQLERSIRKGLAGRLVQEIYQLKETVNSLKKQQLLLAGEVKQQEDAAAKLKNASLPLDVLRMSEDIASAKEMQGRLKTTIDSLRLEPVSLRVTAFERAEAPLVPDHARQLKFVAVGGGGLFFVLLFGVSWWEYRLRRIGAARDVTDGLKMNLVGTLPELPQRARRVGAQGAGRDLHWQNQLAEAVDSIRTLVLHAARTDSLQCVMVTSAMNGEGKTSLASQLAASLARAWRKTLLIDGDLRHPAAHGLFSLPQEPGFSEVLRGEVAAGDVIRPTPLSRLWLMPAGHWDSHAVQALAQESVRDMLGQLKTQYDFIIVDSCPVLPVADALLLGQHVDAVIFSILRDVSRLPTVQAAQHKLNNLGIRTLGAVVIGDREMHGGTAAHYTEKAAV